MRCVVHVIGFGVTAACVLFVPVLALAQVPVSTTANTTAPAAAPVEIPAILTDRPDFTESSEVVPKGGFQFESGISYPRPVCRLGRLPRSVRVLAPRA